MSYARIAGAVVGVVALVFLWWRVSLSFSQAHEIEIKDDQISGLQAAAARDTRIARELSDFRADQATFHDKFTQELAKQPITHKVAPHVDPKTGAVEPCVVRDPARYRELFNQAVTGPAGVP